MKVRGLRLTPKDSGQTGRGLRAKAGRPSNDRRRSGQDQPQKSRLSLGLRAFEGFLGVPFRGMV